MDHVKQDKQYSDADASVGGETVASFHVLIPLEESYSATNFDDK